MSVFKDIADKANDLAAGRTGNEAREPLNKATYVELFFDLAFVFCIRSMLPIITKIESGVVDFGSYYTFWFTFALMLQVWFNSTIFMNRFGDGSTRDIVQLCTNMFLLFVMTRAISVEWENYAIYNGCWILITLNTMAHWLVRYKRIPKPDAQTKRDTWQVMVVLGIQVLLVLVSHLMPKDPAQATCLVAMLIGYSFWYFGGSNHLSERSREHLSERCALLMVLTFGETVVGLGNELPGDLNLVAPAMYFLLVVGMFLIYLNEIQNLLDLDSIGGGRRYMALSAWITFCVANVTAGFEMSVKSMTIGPLAADVFFGISVVLFLLSFFLFTPFNKARRRSGKWFAARAIACLLVLAQSALAEAVAQGAFDSVIMVPLFGEVGLVTLVTGAMMAIPVIAVYAVLIIDRIVVYRARRAGHEAKAGSADA